MKNVNTKSRERKGAMLVLIAITIVLLLVAIAFSVDVAFMQLTRTELRTSTDAAARAATEALSREQSVEAAIAAARAAAAANPVAGDQLLLADEDIIFGHADVLANGVFDFQEGTQPFNSIRVNGRRTDDSPSGPVGLLFAGVLGPSTFLPSQVARTVNLDRDICVVVDRSGSMNFATAVNTNADGSVQQFTPPGFEDFCNGPHPAQSRWSDLDDAMSLFLALLEGTDLDELVGLVSYSSDHIQCDMTTNPPASTIDSFLSSDYTQIENAMQSYTDTRVVGATNIAAGIDDAVEVLTDPTRTRLFAEKLMVVMTDGRENQPPGVAGLGTTAPLTPRGAVRAAMEAKATDPDIIIHTITFSDAALQDTMREVARVGGGSHFHAPSAERLEEIFREIALTLPVVMAE